MERYVMKMRQVIVKVELLEYGLESFPEPQAAKAIYSGSRMFLGEEAAPATEATKYLAGHIGLECDL